MDQSPLSRLSPELRNLIYEATFTSPYAVTLPSRNKTAQHPLLKTCRKIRQEAKAMYYSLTRFNAHLDDGPIFPVGRWLKSLGPEIASNIREINVWVRMSTARDSDMRMLNSILHGPESAARRLTEKPESGHHFVLGPMHDWIFTRQWMLKEVALVLRQMGLSLWRFRKAYENGDESDTSEFAIVKGLHCRAPPH